ncbi:MAG: NAD-dependent epimerase/dehydratase family protein, partial [Phycicoccus sp.]
MTRVAVTGSSGLIGSALVAALRERDDQVVRLVRRVPAGPDEVRWDPASGALDPGVLDGVDA